jgi:AraC-like DNA-binding protein
VKHFVSITAYCNGINIAPPKHPHFDVRSIPNTLQTIHKEMPAFRHEMYAIILKRDILGNLPPQRFNDLPEGSAIFFNLPYQILNWNKLPEWNGYYLMFSNEFLVHSTTLKNLNEDFDFLRIANAKPLILNEKEEVTLIKSFQDILNEYNGEENKKFNVIEAHLYLLLTYIKRLYDKNLKKKRSEQQEYRSKDKLIVQYQSLLQQNFHFSDRSATDQSVHNTSFYASKLNVHANHLNSVVKKTLGITALEYLHLHVIKMAKIYLKQSDLSVKEIAYSLHFTSPNSFSTFFKRQEQMSPTAYRKRTIL